MMTWYPLHLRYAAEMLSAVLENNHQSEDVVRRMVRLHPEWGKRDRKSILDMFYAVLRNLSYYRFIAAHTKIYGPTYETLLTVHLWKMGALQSDDDRWPKTVSRPLQILPSDTGCDNAIRLSVPVWLYDMHNGRDYDNDWQTMLQPSNLYIRVNRLKIDCYSLNTYFQAKGVATTLLSNDAIRIGRLYQLTSDEWYKKGGFEIQDIASQQVVPAMQIKPGMQVLDACAGNGGKSLHMASLMNNQGRIVSTDVRKEALAELRHRAERAGATNIVTAVVDNDFINMHNQAFDRILMDVPCSGLGTLRHKPELKWKLEPEHLQSLILRQREIIQKYLPMLKPTGSWVYSTCSILEAENEEQVDWILKHYSSFNIDFIRRISPSEGGDGFFITRFSQTA
ncbi:MAG: methyltransferase domain-containing protein [Flavobacteriales bacterium]|nr:methyltransferase domain-containing protein [Flavobacteriales bacterium]